MANSNIISVVKNTVVKELIKDEEILKAIDGMLADTPEDYIGKHIFTFDQNPNTMNTAQTFINVLVNIPEQLLHSNTKVVINLEFRIISNVNHMKVSNVPKVKDNRNDYIARLLDKKFNGRTDFGVGKFQLALNKEGSIQADYVYRQMIFTGTDINDSLCKEV